MERCARVSGPRLKSPARGPGTSALLAESPRKGREMGVIWGSDSLGSRLQMWARM